MPEGGGLPELASKELSRKLLEGEAKLEEGSFEEAEVTLREALSINNEVLSFEQPSPIFIKVPLPCFYSRLFGDVTIFVTESVHINPNSQSGALSR